MNKIIGVLWKKEKHGNEYFSGVISDFRGEIHIAVFPNNFKESANQPDFNIVISIGKTEPKKEVKQPELQEEDSSVPF